MELTSTIGMSMFWATFLGPLLGIVIAAILVRMWNVYMDRKELDKLRGWQWAENNQNCKKPLAGATEKNRVKEYIVERRRIEQKYGKDISF